jgi:restriction system protein
MAAPKYYELFNPLLAALRELGGSASIPELEESVSRILGLSDDDINQIHKGNRTKFSYNLAWARTYLKRYGLLDNSDRGVWSLSDRGIATERVVSEDVTRTVQQEDRIAREGAADAEEEQETPEMVKDLRWQDEALESLKQMTPDAFERLCQRLLRESGFIQGPRNFYSVKVLTREREALWSSC